MEKVNIQFIADKAGVSTSLVSKIINNKYVRTTEETRERILRICREYNYKPSRMAVGLRTKHTNLIGCIVPGIDSDFFAELVSSMELAAQDSGYQLVLFNSNENLKLERKYLELYSSGMLDGMIVIPSDNTANQDLLYLMKNHEFPFVFVDRYIGGLGICFAVSDGYYGGRRLTEELLKHGHRNIVMIGHNRAFNTSVQIERYEGFRKTMEKESLPARHFYFRNCALTKEPIYKILSSADPPTGIVLVSSWDISYLLRICSKLSIQIPKDCELATFDRFSVSFSSAESMDAAKVIHSPPIIAEQDPIQMGKLAIEMLVASINGAPIENREVFIRPEILNLT